MIMMVLITFDNCWCWNTFYCCQLIAKWFKSNQMHWLEYSVSINDEYKMSSNIRREHFWMNKKTFLFGSLSGNYCIQVDCLVIDGDDFLISGVLLISPKWNEVWLIKWSSELEIEPEIFKLSSKCSRKPSLASYSGRPVIFWFRIVIYSWDTWLFPNFRMIWPVLG